MLENVLRLYNVHPENLGHLLAEDVTHYSLHKQSTKYLIDLYTFRLSMQKNKHPQLVELINTLSGYSPVDIFWHHLVTKAGMSMFIFTDEDCNTIVYILSWERPDECDGRAAGMG